MTSIASETQPEERGSFLDTFRRRLWVPLLCAAVAGLVTASFAAVRPHEYSAVALLQVNETDTVQKITAAITEPPVPSGAVAAASDLPNDLVTTDVASQIRTYRTAQRAVEFLQLEPFLSPNQVLAAMSVSVNPTTGLVEIRASAPRAPAAARIANAVARGYVNLRAGFEIERIEAVRRRLQRLAREQASNRASASNAFDLRSLTDAIQQLRLAAAEQPLEVTVLRAATPPSHATGISPMLLGLMAATLGFFVGVAMIGVYEVTDRRIYSLSGLRRTFGGPILCRLPSQAFRLRDRTADSPEARGSRLLLARLRDDPSLSRATASVAVGSPEDGNDALGLGWELAETAANAGTTTLLVIGDQAAGGSVPGAADGDLRPSRLDLGNGSHLDVVTAPTNGDGRAASRDARELVNIVNRADAFVVVVLPSPPPPETLVPLLAGARALAVCRRGSTDRDGARRFRDTLAGLDVRLAGVVAIGFGADRRS